MLEKFLLILYVKMLRGNDIPYGGNDIPYGENDIPLRENGIMNGENGIMNGENENLSNKKPPRNGAAYKKINPKVLSHQFFLHY
jgi:hypothetical protein